MRRAARVLRKHPRILIGGLILLTIFTMTLLAPYLTPHDPTKQRLEAAMQTRGPDHPLGTDEFGRDIFSRLLYGGRLSLLVGIIAVGIGVVVGGFLGLIAGLNQGFTDVLIMRIMDVMLAVPGILLAIAIVAALGPGMINVMVAVGISSVPTYARLVRGSVLSVRENEYIDAARALGMTMGRMARKHVLPNVLAPVLVVATMQMGSAILAAAGLSFLGLGAQPPTPEWGAMLNRGKDFLRVAPHIATYPGLAILTTVIGFNLFGDGLRDWLDPRLKT